MYLKTVPDSVFPCSTEARLLSVSESRYSDGWKSWDISTKYGSIVANNERDALGRCQLKCANCNCRMLFNQLECVKADLETTRETLQDTKDELHSVKSALEERDEEKRRFSIAIAKMVECEMSDVRTQLSALNLCLKEELAEKALEKKAASEAAKAALSASNFITLRLLMF